MNTMPYNPASPIDTDTLRNKTMFLTHMRMTRNTRNGQEIHTSGYVNLFYNRLHVILGGESAKQFGWSLSLEDSNNWIVLAHQGASTTDLIQLAMRFYSTLQYTNIPVTFYLIHPLEGTLIPNREGSISVQRRYAAELNTQLGNLWRALQVIGRVFTMQPIPSNDWFTQTSCGAIQPGTAHLIHGAYIGNFATCLALLSESINTENRYQEFIPSTITVDHLLCTNHHHHTQPVISSLFVTDKEEQYNQQMDSAILHNDFYGVNPNHFLHSDTTLYTIQGFQVLLQELKQARYCHAKIPTWKHKLLKRTCQRAATAKLETPPMQHGFPYNPWEINHDFGKPSPKHLQRNYKQLHVHIPIPAMPAVHHHPIAGVDTISLTCSHTAEFELTNMESTNLPTPPGTTFISVQLNTSSSDSSET